MLEKQQRKNKRKFDRRTTVIFSRTDRDDFILWNGRIRQALAKLKRDKSNSCSIPTSSLVMPNITVVLELRRFFRLRRTVNVEFDRPDGMVRIISASNIKHSS
jgi:hypothetical protein